MNESGIVTDTQRELLLGWGSAVHPASRGRGDAGRGADRCGQATKGVWGMSGRRQATKGVEDCDKPGEAVKRALIPGSPNERALNP